MGQDEKKCLKSTEVLWLLTRPEKIKEMQLQSQMTGDVDRWLELGKLNRFLRLKKIENTLTESA